MPVTFSTVGTTLAASVIDENFATWQDLFRSGLVAADLLEKVDRYRFQFFQSGRVVRSSAGSLPWRTERTAMTQGLREVFDLTYRRGGEAAASISISDSRRNSGDRSAYAMDLLGRPGRSFNLSFEEMGLNDPSTYSATGWPPSWWPIDRYPRELCYSRWLTIPFCTLKTFVPFPAIARVYVTATGTNTLWSAIRYAGEVGRKIWKVNRTAFHNAIRTGLIVDTNPLLFDDEWENDNQWIVDPITGVMSPTRSWKVFEDITQAATQRQSYTLVGEVALKGNRHYNFRAAFRDAQTHGWLDHTTSPPSFEEDCWEDHFNGAGITNAPTSANWPELITGIEVQPSPFMPPWINLWERGSIMVELDYGRGEAFVADETDNEFQEVPATPDPGEVY